MAVEVRLPTVLRNAAGGASVVSLDGATIGEVLAKLVAEYPGMAGQVVQEDGSLHKFVNIYLNDDDVRYLDGVDTPVARRRRDLDPAGRGRRLSRLMTLYPSVLGLIGNTPLVDISSLSPNPSARLFIKLEGQNPGGSVKDRVALSMVEQAERDGRLVPGKPDQILMEPSSGNTGIGLALVCRVKGYHLKVVMPTNVSIERRQLLELWGAEIIESPGSEGSNGAVRMAQRLAGEHPEWAIPLPVRQSGQSQGALRGHRTRDPP